MYKPGRDPIVTDAHALVKQGELYQVFERQGLVEHRQEKQLEPMLLALLQNAGDRLLKE